ncbi:NAD(P)H-quinone oxidoreductase [Varunaivibrio sulfuroxidans]|uniref:Putative PIG3 family NAD(P)H quinone oxidoreductase n=1 Tax=Varunaivibrio sulfuroxidans TaxID=1773489 RepID=A0A4R3JB47_9PROT|nr:NAD(P)H-quinone oxidoreductase [Varunaivibrio sulfuroxidans]TCS63118.1 putative PIG3 family NAD(P)H quinone oxidoreductase [Varunaivibrio sulfuroxidans]WES32182.1 NAD(P)H-quinone oxidoreductase [Varunaivibrio sulfuroxidans]
MSNLMRCIEIKQPGGPQMLVPAQRPIPSPGPGMVRIKVAAAGVNRPDILQREGKYPPPPGASDIPGLEVAGTIDAVGEGVATPSLGARVTALLTGGGYGAYAIAPAPQCLPIPKGLTYIEAAALPETYFTVWNNIFERAALTAGETLLVHGGSSGIGTTAIQLAHHFGAKVMTTAATEEKCQVCRELGADLAITYPTQDFVEHAKTFNDGKGVNVILDMVGGDYVQRNIKALAPDGRLVNIAFLHGSKVTVDLMAVMLKRLTLTGSTLRARAIDVKGEIADALRKNVWPLIEDGKIRPVIHATFALDDAAEAHRMMEQGQHIGKIVLTL